jgi:hypothetical protein
MAGGRHGEGLRGRETRGHVSATGRALGLLLSRAPSSRLPALIICLRRRESSAAFLQQVIDGQVLFNQT